MKKTFITFIIAIICIMTLSSCEFAHTHSYGEWEPIKPANCTEEGIESRTCNCGEQESRAIEINGEHVFEKGICKYCQEISEDLIKSLETGLTDSCDSYWLSKYSVSSDKIELLKIVYDSATSDSQGSITLIGRFVVKYNDGAYAGDFDYKYVWDEGTEKYEVGTGIMNGFKSCDNDGNPVSTNFVDTYEFSHFASNGKADSVLEFDAEGNVKQTIYTSSGYIANTTYGKYSIVLTPLEWYITITTSSGNTQTLIYHTEYAAISWGNDMYMRTK